MRLKELLENARDTHRAISTIAADLERVATAWTNIDAPDRIALGDAHPELADALIRIANHWATWADE